MCRGGLRDKWEKGGRVCGIRQEEDSYIVDSWIRRAWLLRGRMSSRSRRVDNPLTKSLSFIDINVLDLEGCVKTATCVCEPRPSSSPPVVSARLGRRRCRCVLWRSRMVDDVRSM